MGKQEATRKANQARHVCPADHGHAVNTTCPFSHRCKCDPCRTVVRDYSRIRKRAAGSKPNRSATGSRRRLRALAVIGYGPIITGRLMNVDGKTLVRIRDGDYAQVTPATHDAIAAGYRRIIMQQPPKGPQHASISRKARAAGWHGPATWGNIDTDKRPERGDHA